MNHLKQDFKIQNYPTGNRSLVNKSLCNEFVKEFLGVACAAKSNKRLFSVQFSRSSKFQIAKERSKRLFFVLILSSLGILSNFQATLGSTLIAAGQPGHPVTPDMPRITPVAPSTNTTSSTPTKSLEPTAATPDEVTVPAKMPAEPLNLQDRPPHSEVEKHINPAVNTGSIEYDNQQGTTQALGLKYALGEAVRNGPRAAAIRAQLGITRAGLAKATQAANPTTFMDRGMMAEQVMRLGPIYNIDFPWELYLRLMAAKQLVAQTKIDLLTQIWSLRTDVRKAYVELVVSQETQRTLTQLYQLSDRLYVVSKKRYEAGAVPELDVLKGHLAASQSSVDVAVGLRRIAAAKQQLNILLGRAVDSPIYIPPLPDFTSNEPIELLRAHRNEVMPNFNEDIASLKLFVEKGIQSRLELKSLGLQMKVNTANARMNYANMLPDPTFAIGKDTAGNEPSGPKITSVFMTLNQETPLTNFQQGGVYQYKATGKQLNFQLAAQRNMVYSDVSGAYQNLVAARDKIRVYQERLLRDSNEVTRLAQRSYEVGQSDINAALQAQQANVQVRSAYLGAINDFASAFADLEKSVGQPLQ